MYPVSILRYINKENLDNGIHQGIINCLPTTSIAAAANAVLGGGGVRDSMLRGRDSLSKRSEDETSKPGIDPDETYLFSICTQDWSASLDII